MQGKKLSKKTIENIVTNRALSKSKREVAKSEGVAKSTVAKYTAMSAELRTLKKEETIDNAWKIIEKADKRVLETIETVGAKDAAIIGKIQTDKLLDLSDPNRGGAKVQVNNFVPILGGESKKDVSEDNSNK